MARLVNLVPVSQPLALDSAIMETILIALSTVTCLATILAAVFAFLAWCRSRTSLIGGMLTLEQVAPVLRSETDRVRQFSEENARGIRQELGDTLRGLENALDQKIKAMGDEANQNRETLRQTIENKLDNATERQASAAKEFRDEISNSFSRLGTNVGETLDRISGQQKERLDNITQSLNGLIEKQERAQEALKQTVEGRLDAIRTENATKLDEMRATVDEKLQSTLEARLGESFNRVVEQLERVHKGIGEMQTLAAGVGDLKKVLANVRTRGTFGEIQLEMLLEQFLVPDQYIKNAQVKDATQERVEFAVKLPGRDGERDVLLPVDAKFPLDDYERLLGAAELGDVEAIAEASKTLEGRIKSFARTISEKYINSPRTTDFAILFLPTEGLYAEALRRPGLFECVQRDYHVTLTGPTTFTAILNALQMGFRSLAIEKRSSEVWNVLGAVKTEFGKYGKAVDELASHLTKAANSVEKLGTRTRVMVRTLKDIEKLPESTSEMLLGLQGGEENELAETR